MKSLKMNDNQRRLCEENIKLVAFYVRNMLKKNNSMLNLMSYDDIISAGNLGLIKACIGFNNNGDYKFSTFAIKCISNEIFYELRKIKLNNQRYLIFSILEDYQVSCICEIEDKNSSYNELIKYNYINNKIKKLIPNDKKYIEQIIYREKTYDNISKETNIPILKLRKIVKYYKENLRKELSL